MKNLVLSLLICSFLPGVAQHRTYNSSNLHSHNDYEQPHPFWTAYNLGFGSIEADIFLYHGKLVVAHDTIERRNERTLDSLYLQPLQSCIMKNNGYPYADHARTLQILIDVKADSTATLTALARTLQRNYPALNSCTALRFVISGNRPPIKDFGSYPPFIHFDGELHMNYPVAALNNIDMMSDNFHDYSTWNGIEPLPAGDRTTLMALVAAAHRAHKTIRFWNAPDLPSSWRVFMELGVDFINTDHLAEAASFLDIHH